MGHVETRENLAREAFWATLKKRETGWKMFAKNRSF
jgi:hypothetical protein